MILQVKVTMSPSLIRLLAPETLTSGRTLKKQLKKLKYVGLVIHTQYKYPTRQLPFGLL